jgi:hypothetical protein
MLVGDGWGEEFIGYFDDTLGCGDELLVVL